MPRDPRPLPGAALRTLLTVLLLAGVAPACASALADASPPGATKYTFDPAASELYVLVRKDPDTIAAGLSHDHVVAATGWSGSVTIDPASPAGCTVEASVPVAGLEPDLPEMRELVGFAGELTGAQRGDVRRNMLAKGQLWADKFPSVTFRSTACTKRDDGIDVVGDLGVHGVTKEVRIRVRLDFDEAAGTARARGGFSATHGDFGMVVYTALFGSLKNMDLMEFRLDVVAKK